MTEWTYELTEAALVLVTAAMLIIFRGAFAVSAAIFALGLIFCVCRAMSRRTAELQIQSHWLILTAAAWFFSYETRAVAIAFLAAYSAMRFSVSLIRYGEAQEILHESDNIRERYQSELKRLRRDSESRLNNAIGDLKLQHLRDNLNLRAEYQSRLIERTRNKNEPPRNSDDSVK